MMESFRSNPKLAYLLDRLPHLTDFVFKRACFHPMLFGALPVLRCLADNTDCVMWQEIWIPVTVCVLISTILFVLVNLILKNWHKSGLVTTTTCLFFFAFRQAAKGTNGFLDQFHLGHIEISAYVLPYLLTFTLVVYLCIHGTKQLNNITVGLNSISLVLCTIATDQIVLHEFYIRPIYQELIDDNYRVGQEIKLKAGLKKPDIYYIIIDACGSPSTLARFYNYDNSDFVHYLEQKGFYIALNTRSNYGRTKHCLPSTLNMRYLDFLSEKLDADFYDDRIPFELIQQNNVVHSLKQQLGYKFVSVSSGFSPTDYNRYADINITDGWGSQDNLSLVNLTLLAGLDNQLFIIRNQARAKRLCGIRALDRIKSIPGPKFVFLHILMPHPPYYFGANGELLPLGENILEGPYVPAKYIALLQFTQKQICIIIDKLLAKNDANQPIIILQGDHGPAYTYLDEQHLSSEFFQERFHPLNAYYFPDRDTKDLYQSVSPVNSFRILFNHFFHANLKLLPDRSFFSPLGRPYDWSEITLDNKLIPHTITQPDPSIPHLNNKMPSGKKETKSNDFD
jgi:hypothetical protein